MTITGVICLGGSKEPSGASSSASTGREQKSAAAAVAPPVDPAAEARKREAKALYDEGQEADDKKDMPRAIGLYEKACDAGEPSGCAMAGLFYVEGRKGVRKDYAKALALDTKGCEADVAAACNNLGVIYDSGKGVERDVEKAAELYGSA
jgi:TPR repeat protein